MQHLPTRRYQVVYADPPWSYAPLRGVTHTSNGDYLSRNSCGADAHYSLMSDEDLLAFPMRYFMEERSALFMWATCPRLDFAIEVIHAWGLHYRGVAYVWVKTNKNGTIMGAKGPPPAFVKPATELLLAATTLPAGRMFPLQNFAQRQVVFAQRGRHSEKPEEFRHYIDALCGDVSKIELFARKESSSWDVWGNEVVDWDAPFFNKWRDNPFIRRLSIANA
jgi:N6-adenosine-specific RNA methylase IME4